MVGLRREPTPRIATGIDDILVGFEDAVAEFVAAQVGPDILDGIEFGAVGRQVQEGDVVGDAQLVAFLVPAGAVDCEHGVRSGGDIRADLREVEIHHLGVGERQHQRGPDAAGRADRTEDIGPIVALIAGGRGPRAALGPDPGQGSLLADAGLVLPPELKRLAAGVLW